MNNQFKRERSRLIASLMVLLFGMNMVLGPLGFAQVSYLPEAGTMVAMTSKFEPMLIKGIKLYPDNPFKFDFIVDTGDMELSREQIKDQGQKLAAYFLASLTTPEKEMWVNLSPYERNRIIPSAFGDTEMGKELLSEDYMLKQIMATALYPERQLGKEFWQKIYDQALRQFGTTNVPISTFNKVWIVPNEAVVYENAQLNSVFVVQSSLKVMLERDYLAANKHKAMEQYGMSEESFQKDVSSNAVSAMSSNIIKQIVIPALEKEVNEGKSFSGLRQVYQSLILAAWYKKNLKDNVLAQGYVDRNKTLGIDTKDKHITEKIYRQYLKAYRKGVYNYIKEDVDPGTQEIIPRKYFSGGFYAGDIDVTEGSAEEADKSAAMLADRAMLGHVFNVKVAATLALGALASFSGGGQAHAATGMQELLNNSGARYVVDYARHHQNEHFLNVKVNGSNAVRIIATAVNTGTLGWASPGTGGITALQTAQVITIDGQIVNSGSALSNGPHTVIVDLDKLLSEANGVALAIASTPIVAPVPAAVLPAMAPPAKASSDNIIIFHNAQGNQLSPNQIMPTVRGDIVFFSPGHAIAVGQYHLPSNATAYNLPEHGGTQVAFSAPHSLEQFTSWVNMHPQEAKSFAADFIFQGLAATSSSGAGTSGSGPPKLAIALPGHELAMHAVELPKAAAQLQTPVIPANTTLQVTQLPTGELTFPSSFLGLSNVADQAFALYTFTWHDPEDNNIFRLSGNPSEADRTESVARKTALSALADYLPKHISNGVVVLPGSLTGTSLTVNLSLAEANRPQPSTTWSITAHYTAPKTTATRLFTGSDVSTSFIPGERLTGPKIRTYLKTLDPNEKIVVFLTTDSQAQRDQWRARLGIPMVFQDNVVRFDDTPRSFNARFPKGIPAEISLLYVPKTMITMVMDSMSANSADNRTLLDRIVEYLGDAFSSLIKAIRNITLVKVAPIQPTSLATPLAGNGNTTSDSTVVLGQVQKYETAVLYLKGTLSKSGVDSEEIKDFMRNIPGWKSFIDANLNDVELRKRLQREMDETDEFSYRYLMGGANAVNAYTASLEGRSVQAPSGPGLLSRVNVLLANPGPWRDRSTGQGPGSYGSNPAMLTGEKRNIEGGIDLEKLILNTKGDGGVRTAFSDPRILQMLVHAKGLFPQVQSVEPVTGPMVNMLYAEQT